MSLESVIHAGLKAAYDADTGAGGLKATGLQQVRSWAREDDRDVADDERPKALPMVITSAGEDNNDPYASAGAGADVLVRFTVVGERNDQLASVDAAVTRIRGLIRGGLTIASSEGWIFAPMRYLRTVKGPRGGNTVRRIVEATVLARQ